MAFFSHRKKSLLARRTFLRGAVAGGVAVALPLPILDRMLSGNGDAFADDAPLPKRFGIWFFGNGVNLAKWKPTTTGPNWQPGYETEPLADPAIKPWISIITGMNVVTPSGQVHGAGPSSILTGTPMVRDGEDGTVGGKSIDILVAEQLGGKTFLRTLELASTKGIGAPGSAFKWISHNGPDNPNVADSDPRTVWTRVFGGFTPPGAAGPDPKLAIKRSILDAVISDAGSLRTQLGARDRARLDQHLTSVRDIERRLGELGNSARPINQCKSPDSPSAITDAMVAYGGLETNLTAINKLQSDLLAMALACDRVRVFTFMLTSPACHDAFPEVNINETFHETFHRQPDSDLIAGGVRYEMARLADTLKSLAAVSEGAGNLLDQSAIFSTTCVAEGSTHALTDYPMIIAGRAGGALKYPGEYFQLSGGDNAAKVPLTVARAAGASLPSFGTDMIQVTDDLGAILA